MISAERSNLEASMADLGAILLVEDEFLIAMDAEQILGDLGFSDVVVCSTFEDAEAAMEARMFQLAIFDMNLNGKMSLPLIERFTQNGGRALIASGYEPDPEVVKSVKAVHLAKPYNHQRMSMALEELNASG